MTELFESTMDNISELEVKCYSDPVKMERIMEILAKRGDEEYLYKFTGPGIGNFSGNLPDAKIIMNNEKLREENKELKEEISRCIKVNEDLGSNAIKLEKRMQTYKQSQTQKIKALKKELALQKETADTWSKEYYMLSIENEKLKKELHSIKTLKKSNLPETPITDAMLVDDYNRLTKENEELKKENEEFGNQILEYIEMNNRLREENKKLEELKTPTIENFADLEHSNKPMKDNVNHPSHYETGKFECIEVMQEVFGIGAVINFCKCNAFKYVYRMDRKNGTEDVKKAIWYLNKCLELQDKLASELFDDGGEIWHGERHDNA